MYVPAESLNHDDDLTCINVTDSGHGFGGNRAAVTLPPEPFASHGAHGALSGGAIAGIIVGAVATIVMSVVFLARCSRSEDKTMGKERALGGVVSGKCAISFGDSGAGPSAGAFSSGLFFFFLFFFFLVIMCFLVIALFMCPIQTTTLVPSEITNE